MCLRGLRLRGIEKQTARGHQKLAEFPDGTGGKTRAPHQVGGKYGGKHKGECFYELFNLLYLYRYSHCDNKI